MKLNSLQQKQLSEEANISVFKKLWLVCACKEENEQKSAKFLLVLKKRIADFLELHPYDTLDNLCLLAKKVERQQEPKPKETSDGVTTRF